MNISSLVFDTKGNKVVSEFIQKKLFELGHSWPISDTTYVSLGDLSCIRVLSKGVIGNQSRSFYEGTPLIRITESIDEYLKHINEFCFIKVKLNDKYEAIVEKGQITVGCQTFPISVLKELNEAAAKLN